MTQPGDDRAPVALAARFRLFAQECRASSPLYARLALAIAGDDAVLALAAHARAGQPVPNLLFGAVHALLLAGAAHPLAAFYPSVAPRARPPEEAPAAFAAFCRERSDAIRELIATRLVQTNEVRRSTCLLPAFACVAAERPGLPLALVELGASAGLNLRWDAYRYDYGDGRLVGDPAAQVALRCDLRGDRAPPLRGELPPVVGRVGIDLAPVDVTDASQTAWLRALVWPEQLDRAALLERALADARCDPPRLLAGDALALLPDAAMAMPHNATLCVFDTFVLNQLAPEARAALAAQLGRLAARRPLAHVSISWIGGHDPTLTLTTWQGDLRRSRVLATCDAHGAWLGWRDEALESRGYAAS
jgi:hypothetical protein